MSDNPLVRFFRKPPVLFPLVMLFHAFLLGLHIYYNWQDFSSSLNAIQTAWYVLALFFMLFICDLQRWAALGYIALTIIGLALQFLLTKGNVWHEAGTLTLFPFDLLMTVFLLFYYKRFE